MFSEHGEPFETNPELNVSELLTLEKVVLHLSPFCKIKATPTVCNKELSRPPLQNRLPQNASL